MNLLFKIFQNLLTDYTLQMVTLGAVVLGALSGVLGTFAVLRRQSLLGDTISHAALPGIAAAFLITGTKSNLVLLIGATISGWVGMFLVLSVVRTTFLKSDTALGIMLSVSFGLGLVLLTHIQKLPNASQAGLDKFLFGQAAALIGRDVMTLIGTGVVVILVVLLFWKEFKILTFDPDFSSSVGFPVRLIDIFLTSLLVISIVLGLQAVGVVLMSAMIVAPAAAARQWTDQLGAMVALSALFGGIAGVLGAVMSSTATHLPTGPLIVLSASMITGVSIFFAPLRGMVWQWVVQYRRRAQVAVDSVFRDLYYLSLHHSESQHGHPVAVLNTMNISSVNEIEQSLNLLQKKGVAYQVSPGYWSLTQVGKAKGSALFDRLLTSDHG